MPDESFSFEWKLFDQVSGPAAKIEASMRRAEGALRGSSRSAVRGTESWALFGLKMGAVSGIAHGVTDALFRIGSSAIGLAESGAKYALEAASFNENTQVALEAVLGSKKAVSDAMLEWRSFAARTPFETRDIFAWGEAFRIAGRDAVDTMTLLKASTDVGALNQFDKTKVNDFVDSLLTLNARGRLDERELMRFAHLHIPEKKILHNIAQLLGVDDQTARQLEHMGQITGQQAIIGVLRTVEEIGGGKGLGALTKKGSQTMSGLFSTVASRPFELFAGLDKSRGYKAIKGVLKNIADVLDPQTASGKRIQTAIMSIGDSLGDWLKPLAGPEGKKNIEDFFKAVIEGAKQAMESMGILASGFMAVMRFMKNTGDLTGQTASAVRTLFGDEGAAAKHDAAKFVMEGVLGMEPFAPANMNALTPRTRNAVRAHELGLTLGQFMPPTEGVPSSLVRPEFDPAARLDLPELRSRGRAPITIATGAIQNVYHLPPGPWNEDTLAQKIAEAQTEHLTATLEKYATQAGN
jgi:hypothetical protein